MKQIISTTIMLLLFAFGLYLTKPSKEEMQKCYAVYSKDYCDIIAYE